MDEAAAFAIKGEGAENRPHDGDKASENNIGSSAEETPDSEYQISVTYTLTELAITCDTSMLRRSCLLTLH